MKVSVALVSGCSILEVLVTFPGFLGSSWTLRLESLGAMGTSFTILVFPS